MQKFVFLFIVALSLTSCTFYEPEYKGGEKIQLQGIDGRTVKFTAGANVLNENKFAIKVKPSTLNLYVEGDYMGKIKLENKVKMKKKQVTFIESPFTATLEEGALFKAMRFVSKDNIQIRLEGKVKAGVFIFGKRIKVNETRTISGANLKNMGI